MSLMDESGKIRNVGVMVSFSVRNPGSTNNGKELVGLYNDRGNVGAFYARRELDGVAIGKGIEKSQPKNVEIVIFLVKLHQLIKELMMVVQMILKI